jgi:iron(III) transport system substrate-binding protein
MRKTLFTFLAPAVAAAAFHLPAHAQDAKAAADLALYQGPDRQEKLVAAAKKGGELSVYHVYPNLTIMMDAFSKKYGIKVKAWRAGSEAVLQRVVTEARGGRHAVDIVQNNAPENEAAHREKLLQEVRSPFLPDLIAQAAPAHKEWAGITLDVWTASYNTGKVKKEELPRSYEDLQDPKWKGRLGIEANNHAWFNTLLAELGEEKAAKVFGNIVATNGISVRKGHSLLTTMVASGEVPLALTVYNWNPEQLKAKGAPIEGLLLQPVIAQPSTIAMLKRAPNPAAAILFYDFMLSEGQKLLAEQSYVVTSKKLPNAFTNVPLKFVDPAKALDMQDKWMRNFDEMIVKKAK